MQARTWLQGKRSSSEMSKKCALLLSKILNCPELWLGVVWNSIRVVLCWGREGGEAFLEALGVDIMYWILCGMLPFESGKGLRLQKSTSHVICPKTARLKCLVHLFFLSFSRALEGECDRFGWWLVCVSICGSLWCWRRPRVQRKVFACSWRELRMRPAAGRAGRGDLLTKETVKSNSFAPKFSHWILSYLSLVLLLLWTSRWLSRYIIMTMPKYSTYINR